jgi:phage replication O-like protein O
MASPQCEHGYTKIANELIEAMAYRICNSTWLKVLLYIIRITYGWQRKEVETNYQSIATKTGFSKDTIKNAILDMSDRKLLDFRVVSRERFYISINKNYEIWKI